MMKLFTPCAIFLIVAISGIKAAALQEERPASTDDAPAIPETAPVSKDDLEEEASKPETPLDETPDIESEDTESSDEVVSNDVEDAPEEPEEKMDELESPTSPNYINSYDGILNFQCPGGKTLNHISSVHSNWHEDRKFALGCTSQKSRILKSYWTHDLNHFRKPLTFECPKSYVITGLSSYHKNWYEDRIWKVRCSKLALKPHFESDCYWTKETYWDARWTENVPNGKYITGMKSHFSGWRKDRRFSFKICKFYMNCNVFVEPYDEKQA